MLEQRIENLEKRMVEQTEEIRALSQQNSQLTTAIEKLTEVLTSGTTPPPIAQVKAAPVKEAPKKETKPKAVVSMPEQPKKEDVQEALKDLVVRINNQEKSEKGDKADKKKGREVALSVLGEFDGANNVNALKKEQYADVIAAAEGYGQQQEAA